MFFKRWYTTGTISVEGAGNVSKSVAVVDTFWLALAKAGATATRDQSPWPGLLQALIYVGAGRPVWP
jgi:hypothetical protein